MSFEKNWKLILLVEELTSWDVSQKNIVVLQVMLKSQSLLLKGNLNIFNMARVTITLSKVQLWITGYFLAII